MNSPLIWTSPIFFYPHLAVEMLKRSKGLPLNINARSLVVSQRYSHKREKVFAMAIEKHDVKSLDISWGFSEWDVLIRFVSSRPLAPCLEYINISYAHTWVEDSFA